MEYIPFGAEWKLEMKKWSKDVLIDVLRDKLILLRELKQKVDSLEQKKAIGERAIWDSVNSATKKTVINYKGVEYVEGQKVKVSGHYAGYKSQYPYMEGVVYLGEKNTPMVRLEIDPSDIEQQNEIELACWGNIEKI